MPRKRNNARRTRHVGVYRIEGETDLYEVRATPMHPKTDRKTELRRLVTATSPERASALRLEMIDDFLSEHLLEAAPRLIDYAPPWLAMKLPKLRPSTAEKYTIGLEHICGALGDHYVDRITQDDVTRFRDAQAALYKPWTVNSHMSVLRNIMKTASRRYHFPDPTDGVPLLTIDEVNKCLSVEELGDLLEAVKEVAPQWYPLTLTLALTGMRPGAATALRWEDIDFERRCITVDHAHWRGIVGKTKTGNRRELGLPDELAGVLREVRLQQMRTQAKGLEQGWVFPSRVGTLRNSGVLTKALRSASERAGISKPVSASWFRHTLSHLVRKAAGQRVQMAVTGHTTDRMALHYDSVNLNERQAAVAPIAAKVVRKVVPGGSGSGGDGGEVQ